LGELILVEKFGKWWGKSAALGFHISIDSQPNMESNIENIAQFIDWYSKNKKFLDERLVFEFFNHDIIHGENFIENAFDLEEDAFEKQHTILESKVQSSLFINDINSYDNKLFVWFSAGEYTGCRAAKAALDKKYEILSMN